MFVVNEAKYGWESCLVESWLLIVSKIFVRFKVSQTEKANREKYPVQKKTDKTKRLWYSKFICLLYIVCKLIGKDFWQLRGIKEFAAVVKGLPL